MSDKNTNIYTTEQKRAVLKDLVLHYKSEQDHINKALVETGEGKRTRPLEKISVVEIKAWAYIEDGW